MGGPVMVVGGRRLGMMLDDHDHLRAKIAFGEMREMGLPWGADLLPGLSKRCRRSAAEVS